MKGERKTDRYLNTDFIFSFKDVRLVVDTLFKFSTFIGRSKFQQLNGFGLVMFLLFCFVSLAFVV
jgi:hypothetical protein